MNGYAQKKLKEAEVVHLARNALIAAGIALGEQGDHWPVVKDTVYQIMRDWENLQTERAVQDEMKKHLYTQLDLMKRAIPTCEQEVQGELRENIAKLKEIYDAYFEPTDDNELYLDDLPEPLHIQRAEAILEAMEEQDA